MRKDNGTSDCDYPNNGGGTTTFTVRLDQPGLPTITVDFASANGASAARYTNTAFPGRNPARG